MTQETSLESAVLTATVPGTQAPVRSSVPGENAIQVHELSKSFQSTDVIKSVSIDVRPGEFVTLLGPSGSGKTTILRCIAGLEEPDGGTISLGARVVADPARRLSVAPGQRQLGVIFQNYALWPHMTVRQHVLYPLRMRRVRRGGRDVLVKQALESVGLSEYADRYPHQLSGGQQQRVAVARALVAEPSVLLMDEPLSNLDVQLRKQLRTELRLAHDRSGAASVYVTHDQSEALAMSDRIVILQSGEVLQSGTPVEVFARPQTAFIARFVGYENVFPLDDLVEGELRAAAAAAITRSAQRGKPGTVAIRAHAISLVQRGSADVPLGTWRVTSSAFDGTDASLSLVGDGGTVLEVKVAVTTADEAGLAAQVARGQQIRVWVTADDIVAVN